MNVIMFQNNDKDLLDIYQYGCDPFCMSLLTDRHLNARSYLHFRSKERLRLRVTRSITRCMQKVSS